MAVIAVHWIYFKVLWIAKDKDLVDNPDARKLQKIPIPVMGGIAVFFGVVAGVLTGEGVLIIIGEPFSTGLLPVLCAMMVMLYIGTMDDIVGLTSNSRIVIEMLTVLGLVFASDSCIDTFRGMWGVDTISWWAAVPLTVFAGVGIINAVNMIDGVNGLSSGLCIVCSSLFGTAFICIGDTPNAVLAFSVAAALVPFFMHNVFGARSRMFIGDAGTMAMGMLLSWFTICMMRGSHETTAFSSSMGINMIAMTLAILSVPVADTLRVMTMRIRKGKSPFQPDKTHLHHVFIAVGFSHPITALSEILMDLAIVVVLMVGVALGAGMELQLYIVIATAMVLVWGTYAFLRYHSRHHTEFLHHLTRFSIKTHLGRTNWWRRLSEWLDAPEKNHITDIPKGSPRKNRDRSFDHIAPDNYKEQDRKKILEFMKGRAEVMVSDIVENSGADRLRVYPILFEEVEYGDVVVIEQGFWGAPEIVAMR